jgi:ubiquinone/menaquinone biosynthesis C-methylase UbiE
MGSRQRVIAYRYRGCFTGKVMANTQFQLEGNAPQLYERYTVPSLAKPQTELLFAHVALQAGDRLLDAACGTGIVTRVAVQRWGNLGKVVGVDLNPGMLDVARANTPATGVPIEWRQGDLSALPFPHSSFDVVLCNQGLQFVPDKLVALREIRRVLAADGRLAFTVWSESPYAAARADALTRHVSTEAAMSCLAPLALRDAATVRQLVDEAGFRAIEMQVLEFIERTPASVEAVLEAMARSPYARDVAAVPEATRLALGQEVCTALQAYRDGNYFALPCKMHLVQARVA